MKVIATPIETKKTDQTFDKTSKGKEADKKMKALVYHGPGKKSWEEKPKPSIIEPSDALIKISKTTICGTDLHILKGDLPEVTDGRILGHEGVGIVEEIGNGVSNFKKGDHVL